MSKSKTLWLEGRLVLYGTIAVTIAVFIFSYIQYRRTQTLTENLVVKQMKASASSLAYLISNPKSTQELQAVIENFVQNMRKEGYDNLQLQVVDKRGDIIASCHHGQVGWNIQEVFGEDEINWARAFAGYTVVSKEVTAGNVVTLDISIPIPKRGSVYRDADYVLHYMIPYPEYQSFLRRNLRLDVSMAIFLALALVIPLALFMNKNVLNPIRKVHMADRAAMMGDEEAMYVPAQDVPSGELGEIIKVRNRLLQSLMEREEETKKLYDEMRESEEKYRGLFEKANDPILLMNEEKKIVEANLKAFETFGYAQEELIGSEVTILFSGRNIDHLRSEAPNACPLGWAAEENIVSTEMVRKDGKILHVTLSCKSMEHVGERFCLSIIRDMTREKELQDQASRAEKLASVGRLSAGIIHEIRNPLTAISMTAQLLEMKEKDKPETAARLEVIEKQVARISHMLEGIRRFSRKSEPRMVPSDLNRIIKETIPLVDFAVRRKEGELKLDLDPTLPLVMADHDQITQVLINLISNSVDAIDPGGSITVETAVSGERYATIKVEDTGCGIPKEHMKSIFEPFFTTKSEEEGTGLGLAIVQGIVKDHAGEIAVESEEGKGTTFTILLPGSSGPSEKRSKENL